MTMLRMLTAVFIVACALGAGAARAELKNQWIEYTHGDAKLKGYLVWDDKASGKRPAVLMIHARDGMSPKNLKLAEIWAGMGYVTFMADIFGYGEGKALAISGGKSRGEGLLRQSFIDR